MAKIKHFIDLEAWKANHQAALEIYKESGKFPKSELFGLTSQIRRAIASVTANIAEGFGRFHYGDRLRFYYQARGSSCEVQNFLILAHDLGYLDDETFDKLKRAVFDGYKVLNGLIRSTEKLKKEK